VEVLTLRRMPSIRRFGAVGDGMRYDWTRAGENTRAPAEVRGQLIAEVLADGTARRRMNT
jgi:hypothetical protein